MNELYDYNVSLTSSSFLSAVFASPLILTRAGQRVSMNEPATQQKIGLARELYWRDGKAIVADAACNDLLSIYQRAIHQTAELMGQFDLGATCGACARGPAGSCCSQGVEDWYDPVLLLINVLLGCSLDEVRTNPADCCFVGSRGCTLIGRHYYCVHHLCPPLRESLGPNHIEQLLTVSGVELFAGWQLEQRLRPRLRRLSP
jgi:hypothetical protein